MISILHIRRNSLIETFYSGIPPSQHFIGRPAGDYVTHKSWILGLIGWNLALCKCEWLPKLFHYSIMSSEFSVLACLKSGDYMTSQMLRSSKHWGFMAWIFQGTRSEMNSITSSMWSGQGVWCNIVTTKNVRFVVWENVQHGAEEVMQYETAWQRHLERLEEKSDVSFGGMLYKK